VILVKSIAVFCKITHFQRREILIYFLRMIIIRDFRSELFYYEN
jgi:hypothetical protein